MIYPKDDHFCYLLSHASDLYLLALTLFFPTLTNISLTYMFFLQRMSSVKNYLRRQADLSYSSHTNHNSNSPEVERPLSEYDNLTISTLQAQSQSQSPLTDIKFRFDDINNSKMSSSPQNSNNNNNNNNTATIPSHMPKYENVIDAVQMRNKRESDQQVKMDHTVDSENSMTNRPVISEAKSSFFGLNHASPSAQEKQVITDDDLDQLIEDCANMKIVSSNDIQQYVNLINNEATSSQSGSSASTFSPSTSPTRDERKNSEAGSHRSKSPKFIIPSPSQVCILVNFITFVK